MNSKDSSEDEETRNISVYTKYDESIEARNAEEVKSPVTSRPATTRITSKTFIKENSNRDARSPHNRREYNRYVKKNERFGDSPTVNIDTDEETDEEDMQKGKVDSMYDLKPFDDIDASMEVKELFQNISRYTPQEISLKYKLIPFLPNYIPAVGDVDAFIKIPRPDGVIDKVGLTVLDEPCSNQSEPAVLHLQLRSKSRSAGSSRQSVIKRVESAEKNPKAIEKWIEDMDHLHRIKHPPAVQLVNSFPDMDTLMQQWPPEVEERLNEAQIDFSKLDCKLTDLVDMVCGLLDIPVFENARLESLHTLFTLFLEVRNIKGQSY